IRHVHETGEVVHPAVTDPSIQPVSYRGTWAVLRLPPPALRGRLMHSGRIYCNGWRLSVKLRSSHATPIMLRLAGYTASRRAVVERGHATTHPPRSGRPAELIDPHTFEGRVG